MNLKGIECSFQQYCFHFQLVHWGKYTEFVDNTAPIPVIRRYLRIDKGENWRELNQPPGRRKNPVLSSRDKCAVSELRHFHDLFPVAKCLFVYPLFSLHPSPEPVASVPFYRVSSWIHRSPTFTAS